MAAPPWTKLRDLEYASLQLEQDDAENNKDYMKWLKMLIAPYFRVGKDRANEIIQEITTVVRSWPNMAKRLSSPSRELSVMKSAFRVADEST
jgi:hypothetical protein